MALEKEKNKEINRAKRMALLRKEVLREIKKTERQEALKKDIKKQEKKKAKIVAQKTDVDKRISTPTANFEKFKDNAVSKKEEKEKFFASAKQAEKKIKIETIPTDIKTNKVKVIFGFKEKKLDETKSYCSLSPLFGRDKNYSNKKTKQQKTNTLLMFFIGLISGCVLILIIGFCVPKSENALSRKISKVIPFPAIIIDGEPISYDYFLQEADMVSMFLTRQKRMGIIRELPTRDEIRKDIKNLLIRREIIKKLAIQYKISVSEKEVKDEIDQIKQKSRSEGSVEKMLKALYGWSEKDFGDKVIGHSLLSFKLAKAIYPNVDDDELKEVLDKKIESEKRKMKIYVLTE